MTRHVVCPVADIPPGGRMLAEIGSRSIVIFNLGGEMFGLLNRCPHQGGALGHGTTSGLVEAGAPGEYRYTRPGEILRCPWHGWEFDIRTGRSRCNPDRLKAKAYPVEVAAGAQVVEAPGEYELQVETVAVDIEEDYVVVEC